MKNPKQLELVPAFEGLCADFISTKYKDRIKATAHFVAERHMIYIRRQTEGKPAPWTKDPILSSYRFCNIYRELDRVTVEIMDEWVKPAVKSEFQHNIALIALLGRVINFTPTLIALRDAGVNFENYARSERAWKVFQKILTNKDKKKRQLVTGAYIVNTVFPRDFPKIDGTKADYIANFFIPEMWANRQALSAALEKNSFAEMLTAYKRVHGVGDFIANQAAVDLTYTKYLRSAPDINDVWSPGPGTRKGIKLITNNEDLRAGPEMDKALTRMRDDLNHALSHHRLWSDNTKDMKTNIVPLSNPNASNCMCETSKYGWMALGLRERLKNTYKGGRP